MKKILLALVALLTLTTSVQAMSYEQARERALFLTDKMAYELNLTDDQYEAAYEINLDYLMTVNTYDDLYGDYWRQRNLDLSYILLDWQYRSFCAASYFYRPIYWNAGCWHFGSMLDIHIAHISTSVALTSMQFIVADIVGAQMVVDHGIMAELMVDHILVLTEDGV